MTITWIMWVLMWSIVAIFSSCKSCKKYTKNLEKESRNGCYILRISNMIMFMIIIELMCESSLWKISYFVGRFFDYFNEKKGRKEMILWEREREKLRGRRGGKQGIITRHCYCSILSSLSLRCFIVLFKRKCGGGGLYVALLLMSSMKLSL